MESQIEKTKNISDYYLNRRSIDTDKSHSFTIKDLGITDDDKVAIQSKLNGEIIYIIIGEYEDEKFGNITINSDINYFFNNLYDPNSRYTYSDIIDQEFTAYISDDISKLGLRKNENIYDIVLSENIDISHPTEKFFQEIFLWNEYTKTKIQQIPYITNIHKIKPITDKKFKLIIQPVNGYTIEWELEIPFQDDLDTNIVAQLIESEGFGDPMNLEKEGEIVLIHKSDVSDPDNMITSDKNNEWYITTKERYNETKYNSKSFDLLNYYLPHSILIGSTSVILINNLAVISNQEQFSLFYFVLSFLLIMLIISFMFLLAKSIYSIPNLELNNSNDTNNKST